MDTTAVEWIDVGCDAGEQGTSAAKTSPTTHASPRAVPSFDRFTAPAASREMGTDASAAAHSSHHEKNEGSRCEGNVFI